MKTLETQLTEFIALTCYSAERLKGIHKVPLGVLEKIISIVRNTLNIPIEFTETYVYRRGSQNVQQLDMMVARTIPISLEALDSKLFDRERIHDKTIFNYSQNFICNFEKISKRPYVTEYETSICELIDVWQAPGGLDNLIFIDLLSDQDAGMSQLIGGLEIISNDIYNYSRSVFYIGESRNAESHDVLNKKLKATTKKIEITLAGVREKINILRHSDEIRAKLLGEKPSLLRKKLLTGKIAYTADSTFYEIVEVLTQILENTWELIYSLSAKKEKQMELFGEGQIELLDSDNKIQVLNKLLSSFFAATGRSIKQDYAQEEELFGTIVEILIETNRWCRALLGYYDHKYFNENAHDEHHKPREIVTFYDIKKSTKILEEADRNDSTFILKEFRSWFEKITSIPKNWSILFGGKISSKKENAGDKLSAYFQSSSAAIESASLALFHLRIKDKLSSDPFRFKQRVGVGKGNVYDSGDQEHCLAINYIAHATEKLCDLDLEKEPGEICLLVLQSFLEEYPQWKCFQDEKPVTFEDGIALVLKIDTVPRSILEKLKKANTISP